MVTQKTESCPLVTMTRKCNPLQYYCLENPMDGGAWWTTLHGVAKSWTRLSDFTFTHLGGTSNIYSQPTRTSFSLCAYSFTHFWLFSMKFYSRRGRGREWPKMNSVGAGLHLEPFTECIFRFLRLGNTA